MKLLFFWQPFTLTSTPKAIKQSNETCKRTLQQRNKILKKEIETSSGSSEAAFSQQTGMLMKTLSKGQRSQILKSAKISPIEIGAEEMVARKVDLGILCEKLKNMAR